MLRALGAKDFDWFLLGIAVAIAVVGAIEIYSTSLGTPFAGAYRKQLFFIFVGCLGALLVSRIDYHVIVEQAPWLFGIGVFGLVALLFTRPVGGARRWFPLGLATLQVSELVKLVIIVGVAAILAERQDKSVTWKDLFKLGVLVGLPAALVALEPDLGTALTFIPIAAAGILMVGIRVRHVAVLALLGLLMLPVGWHFLRPYQRDRVKSFVHPTEDTRGSHYQATQSKIAIGSGGFWGKGIGSGTQSRLGFIPVAHADFAFASYSEEQGFVGTLFVMLLYFILLLRLLDAAQTAGDRAGALLVVGLAALLFFQISVNVGMMIGFLPITGIPLPLMSQGGSSVLATFLGLGMAMSVRMRRLVN
jgi:rod shape determining protein RodA